MVTYLLFCFLARLLRTAGADAYTLRALAEKIGSPEESVASELTLPVERLTPDRLEVIKQTKEFLFEKIQADPMQSLGFVHQSGMDRGTWMLPDDTNPFRMHWHTKRKQVIIQGSYPVNGNHVGDVLQHLSDQLRRYEDDSIMIRNFHFHVNSGSHGDQVGVHADPTYRGTLALAEQQFLVEDMASATAKTPAAVSVLDLARHQRAAPADALVVIDAYCYSGRGLNSAAQVGDTRLLWNVDLIKFKNKLPSPDSAVWEQDVAKKSHMTWAAASAWWATADRTWLLTDVETGAIAFVGEGGFEVKKGPLKGKLQPGDVVYFDDVFAYEWQDMPEGEGFVTIVKEPRFMSGVQLGFAKGAHSMIEAVFGKGAFDRAVTAAVNIENMVEKVVEDVKTAAQHVVGGDEL